MIDTQRSREGLFPCGFFIDEFFDLVIQFLIVKPAIYKIANDKKYP